MTPITATLKRALSEDAALYVRHINSLEELISRRGPQAARAELFRLTNETPGFVAGMVKALHDNLGYTEADISSKGSPERIASKIIDLLSQGVSSAAGNRRDEDGDDDEDEDLIKPAKKKPLADFSEAKKEAVSV